MSGGKEAFLQMVHLMAGTDRIETSSKNELPDCLKKQIATMQISDYESRKWPCLVCAKLFNGLDQLVHHASTHTFELQTDDVYCCFCGLSFPSVVSLNLHQSSVIPVVKECDKCTENMSPDEYAVHVCQEDETNETAAEVSSLCPFEDCSKADLEKTDLGRHVLLAHGCADELQINQLKKILQNEPPSDDTEDEFNEEWSGRCPICRQAFYSHPGSTEKLMAHIALHCPSVPPLPRESAKAIIRSAEAEQGLLDPYVALGQELEANLLHVLEMLKTVSYSDSENISEPVRYLTLLMHRVRSSKFQKMMVDTVGSDFDSSWVDQQFDLWRANFPLMFDLWCASFDYSLQFERGWQGVKGRQSGSTGPLSKLMTDAVDNDNAILDDMGLSGAVADTDCWDRNGPDPAILRSLIKEMC